MTVTVENLSKKTLLEMIESFENYPSVSEEDDRAYILAYLDDEACAISKDDIQEYIDAIEITKDNIHEFYEFMNNDLEKYEIILHNVISYRLDTLFKNLDFHSNEYHTFLMKYTFGNLSKNKYITTNNVFGVEDILKPIDEYIQEIKDSDEYQQYISNKNIVESNISCPKNIKDLIEKFVPEFDYNQDNDIYGKDAHSNTRADLEKFANELQQLMGIKSIQINAAEVSNDVYNELKSETNATIHRKDNPGEFIIFHTIKNGVLL